MAITPLTQEQVESRLSELLEVYPKLHLGGYGRQYFKEPMQNLIEGDSTYKIISKVSFWLWWNIVPSTYINHRHDSYCLKHVAEKEAGYITNGQFIAAALLSGFFMKPSYNPRFNMKYSSVKQQMKLIGWAV